MDITKCKNDHEMLKSHRFCGECAAEQAAAGTPVAAEMRKCGACEGQMLKAAKFCGDCGASAVTPAAEFEAVVADVSNFAKASASWATEAATLPTVDELDVDQGRVDEVLAKAVVDDGRGGTGIDALPIVGAFMAGQETLGARMLAGLAHLAKCVGRLQDGDARLVKLNLATSAMLKAKLDEHDEILKAVDKRGVGRPTERAITVAQRALAGSDAAPGGTPAGQLEDGDVSGEDVIAKCLVATDRDPGALSTEEYSAVSTWCGSYGLSLKAMSAQDPGLGARVRGALQRLEAGTH